MYRRSVCERIKLLCDVKQERPRRKTSVMGWFKFAETQSEHDPSNEHEPRRDFFRHAFHLGFPRDRARPFPLPMIMAGSDTIAVTAPADFHVHLRQGKFSELVTKHVRLGGFTLAYVMVRDYLVKSKSYTSQNRFPKSLICSHPFETQKRRYCTKPNFRP